MNNSYYAVNWWLAHQSLLHSHHKKNGESSDQQMTTAQVTTNSVINHMQSLCSLQVRSHLGPHLRENKLSSKVQCLEGWVINMVTSWSFLSSLSPSQSGLTNYIVLFTGLATCKIWRVWQNLLPQELFVSSHIRNDGRDEVKSNLDIIISKQI